MLRPRGGMDRVLYNSTRLLLYVPRRLYVEYNNKNIEQTAAHGTLHISTNISGKHQVYYIVLYFRCVFLLFKEK